MTGSVANNVVSLVLNGTANETVTFGGVGTSTITHTDAMHGLNLTIQVLPNSTLLWSMTNMMNGTQTMTTSWANGASNSICGFPTPPPPPPTPTFGKNIAIGFGAFAACIVSYLL